MTNQEKTFDTGLRILEVLNMLLENDVSKRELIAKINKNSNFENVYTLEAFIKYFNTISLFGFDIAKKGDKYKLNNAIGKIKLNSKETEILLDLISFIPKLHNKITEQKIKNIIKRLIKYLEENTQKKIIEILNKSEKNIKSTNNSIKAIEGFKDDGQMVEIVYLRRNNVQDKITVKLREILEINEDIILVCHEKSKARNKKINIKSVISITQMPNMADKSDYDNASAVFKVYGRLAELYKLKPGERTIDFTAEYKTIVNIGEDKDILLKRLLKYGENCEIIRPQSLKDDFVALTDEILKNLEKEV